MQLPASVTKKAAGAGALPCNIKGLATLRYDRARVVASVAASLLASQLAGVLCFRIYRFYLHLLRPLSRTPRGF